MNKSIVGIFFILLVLFGCTQTQPAINPDTNQTQNTIVDVNALTTTPSHAQTHLVSIKNFSFTPANLTINVGDTVKWTNEDSMGHTVTGGLLNSTVLQNGESYSFKFSTKDSIDYICKIHPSMKGKIIVQ